MIVAGINQGKTSDGKLLRDGGAALVVDDVLTFAAAEERFSRKKADGGFTKSLNAGLRSIGAKMSDVEMTFSSSCCEPIQQSNNVRFLDHHLSHAALAYYASPFEHALTFVIDAGGNVLGDANFSGDWWRHDRQQFSVYEGRGKKLNLIGQHFSKPGEVGLGEMYRAFTYYLGWNSGRQAGKVMALSGTSARKYTTDHLFYYFSDGDIVAKANVNFHPQKQNELARDFLSSVGLSELSESWEQRDDQNARADIASVVQFNLEHVLGECFDFWSKKAGTKKLCFAGGVALNCTAIQNLRSEHGSEIFVPPGAGDNGQCVGNAILGNILMRDRVPDLSDLTFLGPEPNISESRIRTQLTKLSCEANVASYTSERELLSTAVNRIFNEGVIIWFQGKSEFGARALGNRCLLANPNEASVKKILNRIKKRERFNPFAASSVYEESYKYFENVLVSPFMTETFDLRSPMAGNLLKAVTHEDGSCRAQIFERNFNSRYYDLIKTCQDTFGVSALLNTSLNGSGEPIVESVEEALSLFSTKQSIKTAVIGDFVVTKSQKGFGYF